MKRAALDLRGLGLRSPRYAEGGGIAAGAVASTNRIPNIFGNTKRGFRPGRSRLLEKRASARFQRRDDWRFASQWRRERAAQGPPRFAGPLFVPASLPTAMW